jgi:hypothetical protein
MNNWFIWALLSALFAALTAILAKVGVTDINPNLATAIRTTVILAFTWAGFLPGRQGRLFGDYPALLVFSGGFWHRHRAFLALLLPGAETG